MSRCPSCAKELDRQSRFCDNCGRQLAAASASKAQPRRTSAGKLVFATLFGMFFLGLVSQKFTESSMSQNLPPPNKTRARATPSLRPGDSASIVSGSGYWPCGSSQEALDEMLTWIGRHDEAEVKRTMARTRSVGLTAGLQVKMLEYGGFLFSVSKVRVVANSEGKVYEKDEQGTFLADPRIGRECWIPSDALTR
jgi:hypothetical protein